MSCISVYSQAAVTARNPLIAKVRGQERYTVAQGCYYNPRVQGQPDFWALLGGSLWGEKQTPVEP